jgi:hypothetical protein
MSDDLQKMGKDFQDRVRELAYLMWESAGRQQGMAMEYWIAAEKEVINTVQAAADRMTPPEVKKAVARATKPKAAPAAAKQSAAPAKAETKPAAPKKADASSTAASKATTTAKPAARKTAARTKKTS